MTKEIEYMVIHGVIERMDIEPTEELVQQLVEKLTKQEYSCFYSDIPLVVGFNLGVTRRSGPGGEADNLVLVDNNVGRLKSNMDEVTFIQEYASIIIEFREKLRI